MMSCEEVKELLFVYAGGGCEPTLRGEIAAHLAHCPDCLAEVAVLFKLKHELEADAALPELPRGLEPFALLPEEPGVAEQLRERMSDRLAVGIEGLELARKAARLGFRLAKM